MKKIVKRICNYLAFEMNKIENLLLQKPKYKAELVFWKGILINYEEWFDGKLSVLYGEPNPKAEEKNITFNKTYSSILTWLNVHQKTKYLQDLQLSNSVFEDMVILDIGSGPLPSALAYTNCQIYCLDPLIPLYMEVGFPIHIYEKRVKFVYGFSEHMPFDDNYFDAIISVNAIDHVDSFDLTVKEIQRVLKPGGRLRFHIHNHAKTVTEPLELSDMIISKAFSWVLGFRKISESKQKRGSMVEDSSESYTLWSNF